MNNRKVLMLALVIFVLLSATCLQAGSIWAKRDKNMKELYADDVARQIGDILTINIAEASKTDNKAKRDMKKDTSRSTTFGGGPNFPSGGTLDRLLPGQLLPSFDMSAESDNELKSKADYKDERKFEDQISVVVMDILPNNNLIVMGTRNRNIAGDIQIIEVSGIVRPSDIAFDNTIKSEKVADFRIITKNSGVSAPYTKPGWLGKIFDVIWPF
ncbi:MAG: flagellar basal body L-ring protein FlgH [Planctomycetes bacterium]|nr:flagellar basal body L-ring protein FlgH [Planctomycetota bacterium]